MIKAKNKSPSSDPISLFRYKSTSILLFRVKLLEWIFHIYFIFSPLSIKHISVWFLLGLFHSNHFHWRNQCPDRTLSSPHFDPSPQSDASHLSAPQPLTTQSPESSLTCTLKCSSCSPILGPFLFPFYKLSLVISPSHWYSSITMHVLTIPKYISTLSLGLQIHNQSLAVPLPPAPLGFHRHLEFDMSK